MIVIDFAAWTWIDWSVFIVVFSWIYVYVAFMALCTAKRMYAAAKKHNIKLPWDMWVLIVVLYAIGLPADVVYNWSVGTWRFGLRNPWKITYTSRVQWNVDHFDRSENPKETVRWGILLNAGDEDHIKRMQAALVARGLA